VISACGSTPQAPVALESNYFTTNKGKIALYMDAIPAVTTSFPGAGCLVCLATASAMNSSLTSHFETLSSDELALIQDELVQILNARGLIADKVQSEIKINKLKKFKTQEPNHAEKDFRSLKDTLNADQLLVVDFSMVGSVRQFSSYVPSGPHHKHQRRGILGRS
jgi:hypothetical protein